MECETIQGVLMNSEMIGAASLGFVIGFIAWHAFRAAEASLDAMQLAAFAGALLSAGVLYAFPVGTNLFTSYCVSLACGFFFMPISRQTDAVLFLKSEGMRMTHIADGGYFTNQMEYLDNNWPEAEQLIECALVRKNGTIRHIHLAALPLNESGRRAALKRFARTHPERAVVRDGCWGFTLSLENMPCQNIGSVVR